MRFNSSFVWFQRGFQEILHLAAPLTAGNWDEVSVLAREAYQGTRRCIEIRRKRNDRQDHENKSVYEPMSAS